ncbi:TetR/AcrR family transcriptional regulator [Massilia sp. 9I]|uniref:TetR/AcrR family transcriptional regulator n=1 Tax=Massilia sp. 9I TaxID=2653152 RepID=UPI0012F38D38|nr:TetR/AcrR family transcriptional regulator [Massilia sp. 9I]VXC00823.1 TetR family transcriptional regulator [Massilia sp. 9I]
MHTTPDPEQPAEKAEEKQSRGKRADAQRNLQSLLEAAMEVFTKSGVDAPVREIAEQAGVGVGTLYRHFPQRADLIVAVLKSQIDACADAAASLAAKHAPDEALARWMERYVDFIVTKRGLSGALQSDNAAYAALPDYFYGRLRPALSSLLQAAVEQGLVRPGFEADELLRAVATLCKANPDEDTAATKRMVGLLVDGLRSAR